MSNAPSLVSRSTHPLVPGPDVVLRHPQGYSPELSCRRPCYSSRISTYGFDLKQAGQGDGGPREKRIWIGPVSYICFPPKIRRCCTGGMPSFSSTRSFMRDTCYGKGMLAGKFNVVGARYKVLLIVTRMGAFGIIPWSQGRYPVQSPSLSRCGL